MIPTFIAPTVARYDLLARMLATVDVPVERGLVIDNGRKLHREELNVGPEWRLMQPPFHSMGLAGSINFGITQSYDHPWWLWASDDLQFGPGDLKAIADLVESYGPNPVIVTYRWAVMALNRAVVDLIGLLDEWSFHPIYFDDTDYARRATLAGIPILVDSWGIREGEGHINHSTTVRTNEVLGHANNRSWPQNERAFALKWGGLPGHEMHESPWNEELPLWATKPDLDGRLRREWPD